MNRLLHTKWVQWPILLVVVITTISIISRQPIALSEDQSTSQATEIRSKTERGGEPTGGVADPKTDEIEEPDFSPKTRSELQKQLSTMQFKVTQNEGTEPAFRNQYWNNKKDGIYRCIVCGLSVFSSDAKYKSGTGWPSFVEPIKNSNVAYSTDFHLFYPRKEVHCSRCQAHLGHVFDDGPRDKTGKRYCMNSAAMRFVASDDGPSKNRRPDERKSKLDAKQD